MSRFLRLNHYNFFCIKGSDAFEPPTSFTSTPVVQAETVECPCSKTYASEFADNTSEREHSFNDRNNNFTKLHVKVFCQSIRNTKYFYFDRLSKIKLFRLILNHSESVRQGSELCSNSLKTQVVRTF